MFPTGSITFVQIAEALIALIAAVAAAYQIARYFANLSHRAQLEAKDSVIETNEQTIGSLRARIEAMEQEISRLQVETQQAQIKIEQLSDKVLVLSDYAAPAAVQRFEKILSDRTPRFDRIEKALDRLEAHLDYLDARPKNQ